MKLAIVGSRDWTDYELICSILEPLEAYYNASEDDLIIVSGGASGADELAQMFAKLYQLKTVIYLADWHKNGKAAGPMRNSQIVNEADALIAFWDACSTGTEDSIRKARAKGINTLIVYSDGTVDGAYPLSPKRDKEEFRKRKNDALRASAMQGFDND